jgi:hypothetical protein
MNYESFINIYTAMVTIFDENILEFVFKSPYRLLRQKSVRNRKIIRIVYVHTSTECDYFEIEWETSALAEIVFDATSALILQIYCGFYNPVLLDECHKTQMNTLTKTLKSNLGLNFHLNRYRNAIGIRSDGTILNIKHKYLRADCPENSDLAYRINKIADVINTAKLPIWFL